MQYLLLAKLSTGWIVTIIVLAVLIIATIVLYFFGKKMEKKQAEQQEQPLMHLSSVADRSLYSLLFLLTEDTVNYR